MLIFANRALDLSNSESVNLASVFTQVALPIAIIAALEAYMSLEVWQQKLCLPREEMRSLI